MMLAAKGCLLVFVLLPLLPKATARSLEAPVSMSADADSLCRPRQARTDKCMHACYQLFKLRIRLRMARKGTAA